MPFRVAAVTSHPVQYQSPLFQRLAADGRLELTVFYGDDRSAVGAVDPEFGVPVAWDRPLLEGYQAVVLKPRIQGANAVRDLLADARIIHHLRRGRFDAVLIHSYATRLSLLAYAGALLSRTPVLLRTEAERFRPRPFWVDTLKQLLVRPLLTMTAAVLVIGKANRAFFDYFGVPASRQFLTPYGVDNAYFSEQRRRLEPHRRGLRQEHGWDDEVVVVGFSGKLIERKRPQDVVDAVARLQQDGLRVGLLMIGDGPLRSALEGRARAHRLKWTVFAGFKNQSELAPLYLCMDLFVLPSAYETWGLVVNEAMVFALPVLASTMVGAHADLIEPDRNGYTFEPGDAGALAERLRPLVESRDRRRQFGSRSEALIRRYSYDMCAEGILQALHYVTRGRRQRRGTHRSRIHAVDAASRAPE